MLMGQAALPGASHPAASWTVAVQARLIVVVVFQPAIHREPM
jgi:hypothetical protein